MSPATCCGHLFFHRLTCFVWFAFWGFGGSFAQLRGSSSYLVPPNPPPPPAKNNHPQAPGYSMATGRKPRKTARWTALENLADLIGSVTLRSGSDPFWREFCRTGYNFEGQHHRCPRPKPNAHPRGTAVFSVCFDDLRIFYIWAQGPLVYSQSHQRPPPKKNNHPELPQHP